MNEITPIDSNGNPYPIKVNEDELKKRIDPLSYDVLRKAATRLPSLVSTQIAKKLEFINARHVMPNYLDQKQSFILVAAGLHFMHRVKKMQLN